MFGQIEFADEIQLLFGAEANNIKYLVFDDMMESTIYNSTEIFTGTFSIDIDDFYSCGLAREYEDK